MTGNREHPDFDILNDLLDGYLNRHEAAVVSQHLSVCDSCGAKYRSLASVVSSASELPRSVLPPEDLWVDLRKSLEERKEVVLHTSGNVGGSESGSTSARRLSGRMVALLATAAVVLIALSSGVTALVLRNAGGSRFRHRRSTSGAPVRPEQPDAGRPPVSQLPTKAGPPPPNFGARIPNLIS